MNYNKKTEKNILAAARKVFLEKGYLGASMTAVAISANIEKALLYDYFSSKNHLYYIIFDEAFLLLYEKIVRAFSDEKLDIFAKIRRIVDDYISFFNDNPDLLAFMINESMRHPERIGKRVGNIINSVQALTLFSEQLKQQYEKGKIRQLSAFSFFMNLLSLCLFPIIAKAVIKEAAGTTPDGMNAIIEARKKGVADFFIDAIKT